MQRGLFLIIKRINNSIQEYRFFLDILLYRNDIGVQLFFYTFIFIPIVYLKRNQYPNNHKDDFANDIEDVLFCFSIRNVTLTDMSKNFNHDVMLLDF